MKKKLSEILVEVAAGVVEVSHEHAIQQDALRQIAAMCGPETRVSSLPLFLQGIQHMARKALGECNGDGCPVGCYEPTETGS